MEDNPYDGADSSNTVVKTEKDLSSRPSSVLLACRLLWVCFAIDIFSTISEILNNGWPFPKISPQITALAIIIIAAFEGWAILKITNRRNWARWVILVFYANGLYGYSPIH
jgi:hypothetical protein